MSVLEDVLEEEYARSSRLLGLMEQEIGLLPKGSIRMRNIKGHEYCYLNYRVGDKVKSDYVPAADVDELQAKIERRRALTAAIKEQKRSQKQIIRALGRVPDVARRPSSLADQSPVPVEQEGTDSIVSYGNVAGHWGKTHPQTL